MEKKLETIQSIQKFCEGGPFPAYPANIYLETSNLCNLQCVMCGAFSSVNPLRLIHIEKSQRGFMNLKDAVGVENLMEHTLFAQVFGYGEPTLNPDFVSFLKLCGKHGTVTSFYNNGMQLTDEIIEAIIENKVFEITTSMSGIREDYEAAYNGAVWETVVDGLSRLAKRKAELNSKLPIISVNSLGFRHHIDRFEEFCKLMAGIGVNTIKLTPLIKPFMHIYNAPFLAHHVSIPRIWIEGVMLERAKALAASLGVEVQSHAYEATGVNDEEQYQAAREALFKDFGADISAPMVPIGEFKKLGIDPIRPPKEENDDKVMPPEGSRAYNGHIPASELGAEGVCCLEPFYEFYICKDMSVKPCCYAPLPAHMGSMSKDVETAVWRGSAFNTMRETIIKEEYPEMCRICVETGHAHKNHHFLEAISDYGNWLRRSSGIEIFDDPRWVNVIEAIKAAGNNLDIVRRQRTSNDSCALRAKG
ncbi:MAG: radical SAM protein [Alphaproteobacteria bacterium]|nr:radical SAM protein [Alphaproteobacteria bacterium]